jgi:predicted anti-sigma-YlaC factor YlaD
VDCNEVLEQLGDFLDEDAREELCRAIEAHLKHCRNCKVEVDSVKKTIFLYQADRQIKTPVAVSAHLQAVLTRAYSENRGEASPE